MRAQARAAAGIADRDTRGEQGFQNAPGRHAPKDISRRGDGDAAHVRMNPFARHPIGRDPEVIEPSVRAGS